MTPPKFLLSNFCIIWYQMAKNGIRSLKGFVEKSFIVKLFYKCNIFMFSFQYSGCMVYTENLTNGLSSCSSRGFLVTGPASLACRNDIFLLLASFFALGCNLRNHKNHCTVVNINFKISSNVSIEASLF